MVGSEGTASNSISASWRASSIFELALCCSSWLYFLKTNESWLACTVLAAEVSVRSWLSAISALNSANLLSSFVCVPAMAAIRWANWSADTPPVVGVSVPAAVVMTAVEVPAPAEAVDTVPVVAVLVVDIWLL